MGRVNFLQRSDRFDIDIFKTDREIMLYTEILNDNRIFLRLYKKGKCIVLREMVIYVRKNHLPYNRLGITAGKKIGNAVKRNRARRVIRQAYRENEINMPVGIDIVIVARVPATVEKSTVISNCLVRKAFPYLNELMT